MLMGLQVIAFYPEFFSIQKNLHRKTERMVLRWAGEQVLLGPVLPEGNPDCT